MKICFFADCNHPNTLNWARYFARELAHEVHIFSFNKPVEYDDNLTVQTLGSHRIGKLRYLIAGLEFRQRVRDLQPDVLIGYRLTSYAYVAARTGFRPLVVAAQSQKAAAWKFGLRKPIQGLTARYAVRKADLVLTWAKHMEEDAVNLGAKREKVLTIPRGVQLELFPFEPKRRSDTGFVLITTRALVKSYDLDLAVRAVARLQDRIPGIRLRMLGDGPFREQLEILAHGLGVASRVEFRGGVPYNEVHKELRGADLYLSTVPEDGVSSSLLEAIASGLPSLVADIGANRIWEEYGCNITFFKPGSVESLVHGIFDCYYNKDQENSTLIQNRRIVEKRACWKKNMLVIEKALKALVSK